MQVVNIITCTTKVLTVLFYHFRSFNTALLDMLSSFLFTDESKLIWWIIITTLSNCLEGPGQMIPMSSNPLPMARQQVINSVDSDCIYPTVRLHLVNMSKTSGLMLWRTWPHNEICIRIEYLSAWTCPRRCYLWKTQSWNERFAIVSVHELTSFLCITIICDTCKGSSTLSTQVENKGLRFVFCGGKFPHEWIFEFQGMTFACRNWVIEKQFLYITFTQTCSQLKSTLYR